MPKKLWKTAKKFHWKEIINSKIWDGKQEKMGLKRGWKNSKRANIIHDTVDPLSLGSNPIYPFYAAIYCLKNN